MKAANTALAVRSFIRGEFCPICKEKRAGTQLLCDSCADAIAAEMRKGCAVCGKSMQECTCSTSALRRAAQPHLFKIFAYDPKITDNVVNKTIFVLKWRRDKLLFRLIAGLMSHRLKEALEALKITADNDVNAVVTYIPRSRKRVRKTGIDQSKLLAESLARELALPMRPLLKRRRRGKTQKELSVFDRERNASELFRLKKRTDLDGMTVIIVDDLVASGNTLAQASEVIKHGGAERTIVACVSSLLQKSEAERFEEYGKYDDFPLSDAPNDDIFERYQ